MKMTLDSEHEYSKFVLHSKTTVKRDTHALKMAMEEYYSNGVCNAPETGP